MDSSKQQASSIDRNSANIYNCTYLLQIYIIHTHTFRDSTTDWRTEKNMSKIQTNLTVFAVCIKEGGLYTEMKTNTVEKS